MKKNKIILTSLNTTFTVLCILTLAFGCTKTEPNEPHNAPPPYNMFTFNSTYGFVSFNTLADYQSIVEDENQSMDNALINNLDSINNYTSFKETFQDFLTCPIQDYFFATILSDELVFQVEDYVYHLNLNTQQVFALYATDLANDYNDLISENTSNPNIQVFSFDDDVFEEIYFPESKGSTTTNKCTEDGCGSRHLSVPIENSNVLLYVDYCKYGIYSSLSAHVPTYGSLSFTYKFDFTGGRLLNKGDIYYRVRCGATTDYQTTSEGTWNSDFRSYQSYRGVKPLNKFYFACRLLNNGSPASNYAIIKANY